MTTPMSDSAAFNNTSPQQALPHVRQKVRTMLMQNPAFRRMPEGKRHQVAHDMVKMVLTL